MERDIVGLVHGYGLSGSGSNLWTRSVTRALCREGFEVHLVCQESRPEAFDFVAETRTYDAEGRPSVLFRRDVSTPGRCTIHRPDLEVLPTYVRPQARSGYVVSILDLDASRIEDYLQRNETVLARVAVDADVKVFHVNHVLLLAESLRRLRARTGVGYAVLPHGSAIEYVVRKDRGMRDLAHRVLQEADRILLLNQDVRRRLDEVFPDLTDVDTRSRIVRAGVDTEAFRIVPRPAREDTWRKVLHALEGKERGKDRDATARFLEQVEGAHDRPSFQAALEKGADYARGRPDRDLEPRLKKVAWGMEPVLLYVGRLVGGKGVPTLVTALPDIVDRHPHTRLVLVGSGPLREMLEALVHAFGESSYRRVMDILRWGDALDPDGTEPFRASRLFMEQLKRDEELGEWLGRARAVDLDRVIFTGFLDHDILRHLFPLSDVAVFPSVVDEASPLVVAEAAASGSFPMGTWRSGMEQTLATIGSGLPRELRRLMALGPEPARMVDDIAHNVTEILAHREPAAVARRLREVAVETFDWRRIAEDLVAALRGVAGPEAPSGASTRTYASSSSSRAGESRAGEVEPSRAGGLDASAAGDPDPAEDTEPSGGDDSGSSGGRTWMT